MDPVVHFEMGYHDKKRMTHFYTKVFSWKTNQLGPEMGNYIVVTTSETDEKTGRPKKPGMINGGFYEKTEKPLSHPLSLVIAVKDIQKSIQAVIVAGGIILGSMDESGKHFLEPQDIPGVGLLISFMDTEGNRVSMLQPTEM